MSYSSVFICELIIIIVFNKKQMNVNMQFVVYVLVKNRNNVVIVVINVAEILNCEVLSFQVTSCVFKRKDDGGRGGMGIKRIFYSIAVKLLCL